MYKLYYKRGSCSLAIHALLYELGQEVELINYADVPDYKEKINAAGSVPVIDDGGNLVAEGAAISIYLLEKHRSEMLPSEGHGRQNALYWLMFANASMHPAYSKVFFSNKIEDETAKQEALLVAAKNVSRLWKIVDDKLAQTEFLCGDKPGAAEFLLTIYANWGAALYKDLPIEFGGNVKRMLKSVSSLPSYQKALNAEKVPYRAA